MKKYLIISLMLLSASACSSKPTTTTVNPVLQNPKAAQSAVNPTGGWSSYTSPAKYGFTIKYPGDFGFSADINKVPTSNVIACGNRNSDTGTMLACVFYSGNDFAGTNFEAAAVSINLLSTLKTENTCYDYSSHYNQAQQTAPDALINGAAFKTATGGTGAAGSSNNMKVFRNFHNNQCFEIDQSTFESDVSDAKQFNQNQAMQKLDGVVETFTFSSKDISEIQAINLVTNLPEVAAYIQRVKAAHGTPVVAGSDQLDQTDPANPYWNVRVYEDLSDHVATFAWYEVFQKTGQVQKAP